MFSSSIFFIFYSCFFWYFISSVNCCCRPSFSDSSDWRLNSSYSIFLFASSNGLSISSSSLLFSWMILISYSCSKDYNSMIFSIKNCLFSDSNEAMKRRVKRVVIPSFLWSYPLAISKRLKGGNPEGRDLFNVSLKKLFNSYSIFFRCV